MLMFVDFVDNESAFFYGFPWKAMYPGFIESSPRGLVPSVDSNGDKVWESLHVVQCPPITLLRYMISNTLHECHLKMI